MDLVPRVVIWGVRLWNNVDLDLDLGSDLPEARSKILTSFASRMLFGTTIVTKSVKKPIIFSKILLILDEYRYLRIIEGVLGRDFGLAKTL